MALSERLKDAGFSDYKRWLSVLESQLGIESIKGIKYLGIEAYPILLQFVRRLDEKVALQKLLRIEGKSYSYQQYRLQQQDMLLNRTNKIKKLLENLESFNFSDKNVDVREIYFQCRELFLVPQGAWIGEQTRIDILATKVKEMLQTVLEMCELKDKSEQIFLGQVSGGFNFNLSESLVCRGVLVKDDLLYDFASEYVLDTDVQLELPRRSQYYEQKYFRRKKDEERFFYQVARFGYSLPESDFIDTDEGGETYCSTIRYWFLPMASLYFDDQHLLLSSDALSDLRTIDEALADEEGKEKELKQFLEMYGSHILSGPLHFGGIYMCKCHSSAYAMSESAAIFHNKVLDSVMNMLTDQCYEVTNVSEYHSIAGEPQMKEQTYVQLITVGGPQKVTGFPDWKNGLIGSNKTWKLIDCGISKVAVWDIILHNRQHFINAEVLAKKLQQCWKICIRDNEIASNLEACFHKFVKHIPREISPALQSIRDKRREIEEKLMEPQAWASQYLPFLQEYLCSIISELNNELLKEVKSTLQQVVEPLDLGITEVFSSVPQVMQLVYDRVEEIPSLSDHEKFIKVCRYFKLALGEMKTLHPHHIARGILVVEQAVNLQRNHLVKANEVYEECLLISIVCSYEYNPVKGKFCLMPTREIIESLYKDFLKFSRIFFTLSPSDALKRQAFLIYLTVHFSENIHAKEEYIQSNLHLFKEKINLNFEILSHLKQVEEKKHEWEWLKLKMEDIFKGVNSFSVKVDQSLSASTHSQASLNYDKMCLLFEKIGLNLYFPQKLSIRDAIEIREDMLKVTEVSGCDQKQYAFFMLQKIMLFDPMCITKCGKKKIFRLSLSELESNCEEKDDSNIHPLDGLLAIIHCSDNFLRQEICCRLATCQIAVPLLLPNPETGDPTLLHWALMSIIKEFKLPDNSSYAGRIITYSTPFVSFLRLGQHTMSKSETLNGVLSKIDSENKLAPFYGYNFPGGTAHKQLSKGLVDISWYLPGDGLFSKAIAFANLHGDASDPDYRKQINFLCDISAVHVVLLSHYTLEEDGTRNIAVELIEKLSHAPGGIIFLQTMEAQGYVSQVAEIFQDNMKKQVTIIPFSQSTTVMLERLQFSMNERLNKDFPQISLVKAAHVHGISIDEDNTECAEGKKLMKNIYKALQTHFEKHDQEQRLRELLPLQGEELWYKLAVYEKEQYRQKLRNLEYNKWGKKALSVSEYAEEQRSKMKVIRKTQYSCVVNNVMSLFLHTLRTTTGQKLWYYMIWLKIQLDELSRETLPPLLDSINMKRDELNESLKAHNELAEKKCKEELKQLDRILINSSFGLEHLLREVGQIYEAAVANDPGHNMVQNLPQIAAQLMYDGFPLELLDGNASHLPKTWIAAVFDNLAEILREKCNGSDPCMYVLSVLGVQSSGKSTLLNTVFGVKFSVTAGRCTRGAFMQLIPVHPSLHDTTGAKFVLIIDTEGLRAPELDRFDVNEHDNELATFVIGMSDITIVNIKGEVSGDIDDILNTSVHAFLRMSQVNLNTSCRILHHNVVAVGAEEKMLQGHLRTSEHLDRMTQAAAKDTGLENQYACFNDVIKFDHRNNVYCFAGLWSGRPPMARVSSGYSEGAQHLKLDIIVSSMVTETYHLPAIKHHLENLWEAILQEDFVFTFQNTFEIVEFKSLELACGDLLWELRKEMSDWEQDAEKQLYICSPENIDNECEQILSTLQDYARTIYIKYEEKMENFFKTNSKKMLKWKQDMMHRLNTVCDKVRYHAERRCQEVYQAQKYRVQLDNKKEELSAQILNEVQKLVSSLGEQKIDEQELIKKFNDKWEVWIQKHTEKLKPFQSTNIDKEVEDSVTDFYKSEKMKLVHRKLADPQKGKPLRKWGQELKLEITKCHIQVIPPKKRTLFRSQPSYTSFVQQAEHHTNNTFLSVKVFLTKNKHKEMNFSSQLVSDLLQHLVSRRHVDSDQYKFTDEYDLDMALTACGYAIPFFEEIAENYRRKHDPREYVEHEMKPYYEKVFINMYHKAGNEKIAADAFCRQLKEQIKELVLGSLTPIIVEEIRKSCVWVKKKQSFIASILLEMGRRLNQKLPSAFINSVTFLTDTKASLEWWAKFFTEHFCQSGSPKQITVIAQRELQKITSLILEQEAFSHSKVDISVGEWLDDFYSQVKGKLNLSLSQLKMYIKGLELSDAKFFTREVKSGVKGLQNDLHQEFSRIVYSDTIKREAAHEILLGAVAGCTEQCPFCNAQCEVDEHLDNGSIKHTVVFHRPQCLGSYRWVTDNTMVLFTCPYIVASNCKFENDDTRTEYVLCKDYVKIYPNWTIPADKSFKASLYWKWFIGNYSTEIEKHFHFEETKVLHEWKKIQWKTVENWLHREYGI